MWVRKRLDIGWSDLAVGLVRALLAVARRRSSGKWRPGGLARPMPWPVSRCGAASISCWRRSQLPPKSELLMSAMTIPDMARIVRASRTRAGARRLGSRHARPESGEPAACDHAGEPGDRRGPPLRRPAEHGADPGRGPGARAVGDRGLCPGVRRPRLHRRPGGRREHVQLRPDQDRHRAWGRAALACATARCCERMRARQAELSGPKAAGVSRPAC